MNKQGSMAYVTQIKGTEYISQCATKEHRQPNEIRETMHEQNENITKEVETIKDN